jgi:hypothetical protein
MPDAPQRAPSPDQIKHHVRTHQTLLTSGFRILSSVQLHVKEHSGANAPKSRTERGRTPLRKQRPPRIHLPASASFCQHQIYTIKIPGGGGRSAGGPPACPLDILKPLNRPARRPPPAPTARRHPGLGQRPRPRPATPSGLKARPIQPSNRPLFRPPLPGSTSPPRKPILAP